MNDFLIAFGALWVVICAYAILAYNIKASDPAHTPASEPPSWFDRERALPDCVLSASWDPYPRAERAYSRQRLRRCAKRSPAHSRYSRR
jgi:hypothetical protein